MTATQPERPDVDIATDQDRRELEREFAALGQDALEWAHLTAAVVQESWPDE